KIGKIILSRPLEREQVTKLLSRGKTDLLTKFISKKGRPFSAYLVAGPEGKVGFEFEPREAKAKNTSAGEDAKGGSKPRVRNAASKKSLSVKAK
ncbi:MAG TPA: topoisomerase C-terminal repeat-containing protein, partial [Nitrosospira sp.]|nr:topoisomerase C-terminal repeat-containing protein [Nitrosospira sp.]